MCSRPSVLLSSQRMRPCHNQLQRERQICLHQTCSSRVGGNVSEIFSSPKCNPQLFHPYFFNNRDCKYNNVNVSRSYYYLHLALFYSLQHEEILVCRPLRGCIHSYCSGLLLRMMRPRCHRKWRRVFCEKLEFFQFLWCNGAEWSKDKTQAAESIKWRPQQAYGSNQFLLVQPQTVFSTRPKSSRSRIDKRTARATGNTRYRYSKIAPLDHKMADNCVSLARTNTLSSTIT